MVINECSIVGWSYSVSQYRSVAEQKTFIRSLFCEQRGKWIDCAIQIISLVFNFFKSKLIMTKTYICKIIVTNIVKLFSTRLPPVFTKTNFTQCSTLLWVYESIRHCSYCTNTIIFFTFSSRIGLVLCDKK